MKNKYTLSILSLLLTTISITSCNANNSSNEEDTSFAYSDISTAIPYEENATSPIYVESERIPIEIETEKVAPTPIFDYKSIWESIVKMPQIDFTGHNALNFDGEEKQYIAAVIKDGHHMDFFDGTVAVINKRPYYNQRPCVYIIKPKQLEYMTEDDIHMVMYTDPLSVIKYEDKYVVKIPCIAENTSSIDQSLYGWDVAYGIIQEDSDDLLTEWCETVPKDWFDDCLNKIDCKIEPNQTKTGYLYYIIPDFLPDKDDPSQIGYNRLLIACRIDGFSKTMTRAYIGNFDIKLEKENENADNTQ